MDIVIIEDEDLAAASLENLLLKSNYSIHIKKRLESVAQSIEWFKNNSCDLILSDIHLGDGESFEIFEALKINVPIIFTTAFDQYAIQSFQFFAIDYLLKPYDKHKLNTALEKYKNYAITPANDSSDLEKLLNHLKKPKETKEAKQRFLVSRGEKLISITADEIAYFMAENKSLFLYTIKGDSFLYDDTIMNLDLKLSKKDFFKINRKFIVRHTAIKTIIKYSQNRLKIELEPSSKQNDFVLISSKNVRPFKEWLNN
ncbi:LytTR family DNA-binding domain-containing protein [Polaribacter undariae]|uniref:LytTR family DNA-binding domain-containing protein n=1 Tax=Polaribacter sejongensis TaxID=985043 RepID=A0AAJ1VI41_9FLAO|nr:LytTR family DNA-binding domain-containing protein [Polaribacter undariae]MDN3621296.1 LytTR family DNA-binding domain-containing protein [Polaribacter undariae]UWD32150.1 LytTR family DNA-binding domain-containing protein [Polaribacter undariae]